MTKMWKVIYQRENGEKGKFGFPQHSFTKQQAIEITQRHFPDATILKIKESTLVRVK